MSNARCLHHACAHLAGHGCDNVLGVNESGAAQVVEAVGGKDLGSSLKPDGLRDLDARVSQELRHDAAQGAEHGPAGVDHLSGAVAAKGLWVSREAGCVPAVISGELTGQVVGGGGKGA